MHQKVLCHRVGISNVALQIVFSAMSLAEGNFSPEIIKVDEARGISQTSPDPLLMAQDYSITNTLSHMQHACIAHWFNNITYKMHAWLTASVHGHAEFVWLAISCRHLQRDSVST